MPQLLKETELDFVLRRLDSWVENGRGDYERRKGGGIKELHFELTHRCNLRCVMCHHWEMPFKDPASVKREMDLQAIRALVEESRLLDEVEIIVLTGGEPWLRSDIVDVAAFLSSRFPKASIGILTNFVSADILGSKLRELKARGVDRLWLGSSLDGLEKTHDLIRGRKGAFRGLIESARMVRAEFPGIDFSFSFTITPKNHAELFETYRFVSEMGLWFGAQMVVDHEGFEAPERFVWKKKELASVEKQIDLIMTDLCRTGKAMDRLFSGERGTASWLWSRLLYWRYLRRYSSEPKRFFRNCQAGSRYAMLDPEGKLFFCPVNKHRVVGDARAEGLDSVWTSKNAREERRFVDSARCHCWLNCIANPIIDGVLEKGLP